MASAVCCVECYDDVERFLVYVAQQQPAGERLIVGVTLNDLAAAEHSNHLFRPDPTFEHPLRGMSAEDDLITVHRVTDLLLP